MKPNTQETTKTKNIAILQLDDGCVAVEKQDDEAKYPQKAAGFKMENGQRVFGFFTKNANNKYGDFVKDGEDKKGETAYNELAQDVELLAKIHYLAAYDTVRLQKNRTEIFKKLAEKPDDLEQIKKEQKEAWQKGQGDILLRSFLEIAELQKDNIPKLSQDFSAFSAEIDAEIAKGENHAKAENILGKINEFLGPKKDGNLLSKGYDEKTVNAGLSFVNQQFAQRLEARMENPDAEIVVAKSNANQATEASKPKEDSQQIKLTGPQKLTEAEKERFKSTKQAIFASAQVATVISLAVIVPPQPLFGVVAGAVLLWWNGRKSKNEKDLAAQEKLEALQEKQNLKKGLGDDKYQMAEDVMRSLQETKMQQPQNAVDTAESKSGAVNNEILSESKELLTDARENAGNAETLLQQASQVAARVTAPATLNQTEEVAVDNPANQVAAEPVAAQPKDNPLTENNNVANQQEAAVATTPPAKTAASATPAAAASAKIVENAKPEAAQVAVGGVGVENTQNANIAAAPVVKEEAPVVNEAAPVAKEAVQVVNEAAQVTQKAAPVKVPHILTYDNSPAPAAAAPKAENAADKEKPKAEERTASDKIPQGEKLAEGEVRKMVQKLEEQRRQQQEIKTR